MATGGRGRGSGAGVGWGQRQVSAGIAGLGSGGRRGAETPPRCSGGRGQKKGPWTVGRVGPGPGRRRRRRLRRVRADWAGGRMARFPAAEFGLVR